MDSQSGVNESLNYARLGNKKSKNIKSPYFY